MSDPIIAEIRKSRAELAERAGNDLKRFGEIIAEEEQFLEQSREYRFVSELRVVPAESLKENFEMPAAAENKKSNQP